MNNSINAAKTRDMVGTVQCHMCGTTHRIAFNSDDFERWQAGDLIQRAMPYLTSGERELLISGTCESCFDHFFGDPEDGVE